MQPKLSGSSSELETLFHCLCQGPPVRPQAGVCLVCPGLAGSGVPGDVIVPSQEGWDKGRGPEDMKPHP